MEKPVISFNYNNPNLSITDKEEFINVYYLFKLKELPQEDLFELAKNNSVDLHNNTITYITKIINDLMVKFKNCWRTLYTGTTIDEIHYLYFKYIKDIKLYITLKPRIKEDYVYALMCVNANKLEKYINDRDENLQISRTE